MTHCLGLAYEARCLVHGLEVCCLGLEAFFLGLGLGLGLDLVTHCLDFAYDARYLVIGL